MNSDDRRCELASEFRVRARFYAINQSEGERAYDWYRRVRAAAIPCGFGISRQSSAVADKFVTGLRPGPVADRLLGERADGPLEDLLALAVGAEVAAEVDAKQAARGGGSGSAPLTPVSVDRAVSRGDVLDEIREGLKLYRYGAGGYAARAVGGGDAGNTVCNEKPLLVVPDEKMLTGNLESTLCGNSSWWENKIGKKTKQLEMAVENCSPLTCNNCCNLATKLLESLEENAPLYHSHTIKEHLVKRVDHSNHSEIDYHHDDSKCYCSRLSSGPRETKTITIGKATGHHSDNPISKCSYDKKIMGCCCCSV